MAAFDISAYKMNLLRDIINCPEIISGIDSQSQKVIKSEPDSLIYENIFPFLAIENTQTRADAYILLAVDVINPNKGNKFFKDMRITVWVFCSSARMRMDNQNAARIDYISAEVEKLLAGQTKYGYGVLELISNRELIYDPKYQYRELVFKTVDISKNVCE
jgi:hypothetical protein